MISCGGSEQTPPPAPPAKPASPSGWIEIPADSPRLQQIRLATVEEAEMPTDEFTAPGRIEENPGRVAKILAPVPGRISEVKVRFGDAVQKDQILLLIESPEADAAASAHLVAQGEVTQAKARLSKAEADLERVRDLFAGDAIAKKEVIAVETEEAQAKVALQQAETALQQARVRLEIYGLEPGAFRQRVAVRAPVPGKITEMNAVAGEFHNDLSVALMRVADLSTVWVSADVPETAIRLVQIGEVFEVRLSAFPGEVLRSKVTRIADSVDVQSRTIEVWAELANPQGRLRPAMFAEVRHIESLHRIPVVPASAVIQVQGRSRVYVERETGKFEQREIVIGKRSGDRFPVNEGLRAGERVVVDGAMLLRGL
ncbi:efflux RND transporter periplasmic adaptor subunit [Oscillatoria amoena NRMC-F 0135]|nr:efflux RND transporter periplasmic adaptor subunit [Oscillatoria amoena NRMC-F 0135]